MIFRGLTITDIIPHTCNSNNEKKIHIDKAYKDMYTVNRLLTTNKLTSGKLLPITPSLKAKMILEAFSVEMLKS